MGIILDRCAWKLVPSEKFVLGQDADRCGEVAAVKILRPYRKTDLFLCEFHLNSFIKEWGLHNELEILCFNWLEGTKPQLEGYSRILEPCKHGRPECECGGYLE